MNATSSFVYGQRVTTSGFPGTIERSYSKGMVEVRLPSGLVCVPVEDVEPAEDEHDARTRLSIVWPQSSR